MSGLTFVLLPGAGGSAWYWYLVAPELRRLGYDTLAVDLPGDDESAGLPEYADAALKAIGDRENLVLVAQSLGGFTAPLVCQRAPVKLLVFVNAMIPASGETAGEWWGNTGQEEARRAKDLREGRDPDAAFDPFVSFLHDVPEPVVQDGEDEARPQTGTPFGSPPPLQAWPNVPIRAIASQDDRFFPIEFQRRVVQERLGFAPDELPGGHLVALSHPTELAERLVGYVKELGLE